VQIVVTGADGFIGRNLMVRLGEIAAARAWQAHGVTRSTPQHELDALLDAADAVVHLAGVNRPPDPGHFMAGNAGFTQAVCNRLAVAGRKAQMILASSVQAAQQNAYGESKLAAENATFGYGASMGARVNVFRLPNVFGKWARPNYNSAVATFCHNLSRGLEIHVNPNAGPLRLVYVDDVVDAFLHCLSTPAEGTPFTEVRPVYETTLGEIVELIRSFQRSRTDLLIPPVGQGFVRALYSTYVSYLEPQNFSYPLTVHRDPRGEFVEMLRTADSGQFSYFSAHPGVTRGEHYHHTKTERFLVLRGRARFGFRHISTGEVYQLDVEGGSARIVETIPGWTHNITNIGDTEMVVMLWANELFDKARPDTVAMKV
jgi:UDP-2-acetamido-2,6-beta-L-arabino-hexul-4-ose reductase